MEYENWKSYELLGKKDPLYLEIQGIVITYKILYSNFVKPLIGSIGCKCEFS